MQHSRTIVWAAVAAVTLTSVSHVMADPWSFGVMADTQWTGSPDDGKNPNSVAVDVITQLNQQFINKGVKLVVAVGDVTDNGSNLALDTRAAFAQPLYNAGIGFYPLRGNHESSTTAAAEFQRIFPQTQNGANNATPSNVFSISNPDSATQPLPTKSGSSFNVGTGFSSPSANLNGLSYSFNYNNASFVMLDQFTPTDGKASDGSVYNVNNNAIAPQQTWINSTLKNRPANTQAFVFGHKGLITENHVDTLLGANPNTNAAAYNAFESSLQANGVKYYVNGHDHMDNRAIVTSPDGKSSVQNIVCASDSSKFYGPATTPNDTLSREKLISQELGTVGYYIYTVDGPRVTVDYYSTSQIAPTPTAGGESVVAHMSNLNFSKHETFGYDGANGKEYQIAKNGSYSNITPWIAAHTDSYGQTFRGTNASLSGTNGNTATAAYDNRDFIKVVDTGWTGQASAKHAELLKSDALTIWGLTSVNQATADRVVLSLTYDASFDPSNAGQYFGITKQDADGNWNFVGNNFLGNLAYDSAGGDVLPVGSYGYDGSTHTAWAVISQGATEAGTYAVAVPEPTSLAVIGTGALLLVRRRRHA